VDLLRPLPFGSLSGALEAPGRPGTRSCASYSRIPAVALHRRAEKLRCALDVEEGGAGTMLTWRVPLTEEQKP
jgi:hypothetical protein